MFTKERSSTEYTWEVESPFINEEFFVGETEEALRPRVALLAMESPFLQFNPGDFEKETISNDERALGADTFNIPTRWAPYEFDIRPIPSANITKALDDKDWTLALKLAIQEGWRDENEMTNLIFFARHPDLPKARLDPKGPNFKKLSAEWTKILNDEVWKAIEASAENLDLVVSGKEVADHHRRFFVGKSGKRLKKLVEDAATEVDLNPGLLGTIMMAETRRPQSYLSSEKASSYHIGADDFFEGRDAIKARVPAYAKVKWDKKQKPLEHLNDAKKPRLVKTIMFDSGPDAVLATAVYVKFREVRLREIAADSGEDFDSLPLATRLALTRMAMAAGTAGATPYLKDALKGKDIFVREAIPVQAYQTKRNATVRTAQAMHLSNWVFGIPVAAAAASQPELEESKGWNQEQSDYYDVYSEHEGESGDDSESADFEDSYISGDRDHYEGNFDLERLDISAFEVEPLEKEEEWDALMVREGPDMRQDEQPALIQYDLPESSTRVVVVGQRIELDLNDIEFAKESEDIKWTIPGVVVRGYDGTAKDAKLFKLTDADLQRPKIYFFWVDAADGRIVLAKFRMKSGGLGRVAFAFDVKGPTVSGFTARTDVTRLEKSHGLLGMRFGKLVESPGIKWQWKISMPPTHEGFIKDVQTVLNDRTKILLLKAGGKDTRKLVWRHPSKTDPHVQVDGDPDGPEYTKGLPEEKRAAGSSFTNKGTSDSPHTDLPSLAKTVSVNDLFTYYVMFKPATKKEQDAIWVPVAKANWFWKATATRRDKKWLLRQPKPKMEATITLATADFPIYETNAFENEWQEA